MTGVWADLDGIRALGDLMKRQSDHVCHMADYMHETCHATDAFDGVLLFFRDAYSQALRYADEGLRISIQGDQLLSERCEKTAANYEASDRSGYDAFARLAGGQGWDVSAYRPSGSGTTAAAVGGPFVPSKDAKPGGLLDALKAVSKTVGDGVQTVTDPLGTVMDPANEWGKDPLKAVQKGITDDTVMWEGKPVLKERLDSLHKREEASGGTRFVPETTDFDKGIKTWNDALKKTDPAAEWRDKIVDKAADRMGLGDHTIGTAATQHKVNTAMTWTTGVMDTYSAAKSFGEDPTLGIGEATGELVDVGRDIGHYMDISHDKADTSVRDELRGG